MIVEKREEHTHLINSKPTKRLKSSNTTLMDHSNIQDHIPCKLFLNFLNPESANNLLLNLIQESKTWDKNTYIIANRVVSSPHLSCEYTMQPETHSATHQTNSRFFTDEMINLKPTLDKFINGILNTNNDLQVKSSWKSNLCIANLYKDETNSVGAHSDKLTLIGPLPTIASLTLGCERIFKIIHIQSKHVYNVHLPHNSLLVMLPSFQELYRHSVPLVSRVDLKRNPISGLARFNLTFRMVRDDYANGPKCCCNLRAELRCVNKVDDTMGRYFYSCPGRVDEGDKGVGVNCGFFEWL